MNFSVFLAATFFGFEIPLTQLFIYGAGIAVVLFALPSYISVWRQRGIFVGTFLLLVLGLLALSIETLTTKTGVPYGKYTYDAVLGNKILDAAPWTIGIAFPIVLLAAFWFASKVTTTILRPFLAAVFTTVSAVVFAPAVVKLELWKWENPGPFFGIPFTYFIGWFVVGLAGAWLIHIVWLDKRARRGIAWSGIGALWFWTGVNFGVNQWIPAGIGAILSVVAFLIMIWERKNEKSAKDKD